eukprot:1698234-Amphidinium_carterae.1
MLVPLGLDYDILIMQETHLERHHLPAAIKQCHKHGWGSHFSPAPGSRHQGVGILWKQPLCA